MVHTNIFTHKDTSTPTEGHHIQNVPRQDLSPGNEYIHARESACVFCVWGEGVQVKLVLLKVFPAEINHSGPGCIIAAINHWA